MKENILIIGQGLAGTMLAMSLDKYNIDYNIVDDCEEKSCSVIGAGMLNPITGRRMVKTWHCDEIFSFSIPYYKALEQSLGIKVFHEKDIYRPFIDAQQHNDWSIKHDLADYKRYIKRYYTKEAKNYNIRNPHGGLLIQQSGWVDNKILLNTLRKRFAQKRRFWNVRVSKSQISKSAHGFWQLCNLPPELKLLMKEKFTHIILSCGLSVREWFGFNRLPLIPLKGELLTIKPTVMPKAILSSGFFCIPISEDLCKLGTTYERTFQDEHPSQKGKNDIITKAKKHLLFDFKVTAHQSGIRPSTKDRHPFIGWSKDDNTLGVFTGFGSKGGSLIPFFADKWVKNTFHFSKTSNIIDNSVDISRFNM